jgi:hypothetical protein
MPNMNSERLGLVRFYSIIEMHESIGSNKRTDSYGGSIVPTELRFSSICSAELEHIPTTEQLLASYELSNCQSEC